MENESIWHSIWKGIWYSRQHLIHSYLIIPIGIIILLIILYGLNILLADIAKIKFPSSVLGLLINLVFLCVLSVLSELRGDSKFIKRLNNGSSWILTNYLRLIKPSMNFTLKWINVFFIPSFVILPLSEPISFIECLKIAGVFVVGLAALILADVGMIRVFKLVLEKFGYKEEKIHSDEEDEIEMEIIQSSARTFTSMRDDITTIDLDSLQPNRSNREVTPPRAINENPFDDTTSSNLPEPEPIYHKPHHVDTYPRTHRLPPAQQQQQGSDSSQEQESIAVEQQEELQELSPITVFITNYIDWILYFVLFIISLPLYYVSSIHTYLPYHLSITVLSYYVALLIPQKYPVTKKFAHPIIISTGIILFICFIGSLIYHHHPDGFLQDLKFYKTGKNYLNLFSGMTLNNNGKSDTVPTKDPTSTPQWPGCGDFLSSLMDISIVSLSLPMFSYRRDFINNFHILAPTILASIGLTFFIYPIVCHSIGIEAGRSIGFIGRSVTLALGTPLIQALGGSVSLMAVCTILSGILGVLINEPLFKLLRVDKQDYVTRGVTLGINCGAIATAHLLNVDPRAASMSSLSFSVFGTVMVIMASINAVRELVRSWVGL
ncbi:Plastidal glycolate/glycerate translocator 1, chloroplastic [Candida tropicalis]